MVDITVRGAGILGLSVAWECARRGAHVRVIDPHGPGAGSSGGIVGALAPHVPENWNPKKAFQLDSLMMAESFWAQVADTGGLDAGYNRSGRLQPIADEAALALARTRAETAHVLWQGQADWTVTKDVAPEWAPPSPTGAYVFDTLSAHLHPRRACAALVAALRSKGIAIETQGRDEGAVLWATGVAGLTALNQENPRQVGTGIKGQAALLRFDAVGLPQLFVDGLHVVPHQDGTVAIGSTTEPDYTSATRTDAQLDLLVAKARTAVPALGAAPVVERWAAARPRSRSRAPMLGPWPRRPGHFIANGGFKIGFGMAPKIAQVMTDVLLEGQGDIPDGFEVSASF